MTTENEEIRAKKLYMKSMTKSQLPGKENGTFLAKNGAQLKESAMKEGLSVAPKHALHLLTCSWLAPTSRT